MWTRRISKTLLVALVGAMLLLITGPSEAQRGLRGGRWGGGYGGYYAPGYGYGGGSGYGGYGGYGGFYGGYPSSSYSNSNPYYYGNNNYAYPPAQYQSNYPPAAAFIQQPASNAATVIVNVPDSNAEVWLQNARMPDQGTVRRFETTALDPTSNYAYTIRARWMQNGQLMDQTRQVPVHAGQTSNVDFASATQ
jgi:uncharacterized protein (TIGR03000 family)